MSSAWQPDDPQPGSKYADFGMVSGVAFYHCDPYMQDIAIQLMKAWGLLAEIANSDMAMREEDEGNVSPLLERVRQAIPTKGSEG